jgi:hypothetical protein
MTSGRLELGAVYQPGWDDRPIRIIAFDDAVVMYDAWVTHKNAWGFARRIPSSVVYFRAPTAYLFAHGTYLRTEAYTDAERAIHRPDLPLAFAQSAELSWYDERPKDRGSLIALVRTQDGDARMKSLICTPTIYMCPFSPREGVKRGVLLKAENGKEFSVAELLWEAWRLQTPHLRDLKRTSGVGLYRAGLQGRTPSYYIWGAISMLESEIADHHARVAVAADRDA